MFKRGREEDEVVEVYAALLRQSGARAVERIRQRQSNNTGRLMPIDALVIRYAMWFLDTRAFPVVSYVSQAQRIVTEAIERVSFPQHFSFVPLSMLVECLVAENTAEVMQQTISSIEEFIDARDALGRWIDEKSGPSGVDDYERYNPHGTVENEEEEIAGDRAVELAGILWRSAFFWVAVLEYIEALSLSSAKVNAFALRPRYELELMRLLNTIATPRNSDNKKLQQGGPVLQTSTNGAGTVDLDTSGDVVKAEDIANEPTVINDHIDPSVAISEGTAEAHLNTEAIPGAAAAEESEALTATRTGKLTRLLADLTALVNCPADNPAVAGKINPTFYTMVHARLNVLAACDRLDRFGTAARVAPPPLTSSLQALQEQREAIAAGRTRREAEHDGATNIGLPLDFVASESYMRSVLEKENDILGEDEELFKDEIVDYYKQQPARVAGGRRQAHFEHQGRRDRHAGAVSAGVVGNGASEKEPVPLVKPHRFCKVKTGYTWTQYNRTHYDARTNPPPRSVLWYEFTLFYPALANTKRNMSRIYRIEDTIKGPKDDYCVLVFSVGPPYADVAYQIVRKQWDPRPGGVRASFNSSGTYRLFFRFTNSNYRR
uniref:Splicing factor Cactin C-terminal domain-containing protein n=1 Tax=Trypanosoma vivax (strain Y486) TaxID=1055687 RepID=G0UD69_TRYVY|nr:conserved hypothetical protein [Trypanosoma vivax Y486]